MELIDGITLKQYMQRKNGSLDWREALYFTAQIIRALGHAHGRGIIHRDIKPQNIMVLRDGSVKVADFGIARIMSATQATLTQEALGSVHYISPEQARGSHIDARADIYSAGVVLYEMLTGRLPFDGDSPVSVAIQHINATPLSPRELNPEIPVGLEEITMKAMAARIDQRYLDAGAMLRDLEDFRKNPKIVFHYDLASFHGNQPVPEEPLPGTDGGTGTMGRRQRAPVRTRPAPPPPPRRREDYPEEEEEKDSKSRVVPIVIIVFLLGAALILWLTFFSGIFNKTPTIEVPDLRGMTLTEIYGDEEIMEKFKVVQGSVEYSDQYDKDQVMEQSPKAGKEVEEGATITVTISGGQEAVRMIDVKKMTYEDAVKALQEIGLNVDSPDYEFSDDIDEDCVISYSPSKGSEVYPGDKVHLVVSKGPESKKVIVPSVTGQSIEKARQMLEDLGLKVGSVEEIASDKDKGIVVYQSIAPNTEVEEGTSLTLHYSKGPDAPSVGYQPISVTLPTDRESVTVRITVGGHEAYNQVVNTAAGTVNTTVSGTGTQEVCIYIDDELVETKSVQF